MRVVILIGGGLTQEIFVRGSVHIFEGCSEDFCIFSFLSTSNILYLVYWYCDHFDIHCTYIWFIYILMYVLSPISPCVVSFLSLYTCFLLSVCNLLFLFHTKMH